MNATSSSFPALVENVGVLAVLFALVLSPEMVASIARPVLPVGDAVKFSPVTLPLLTVTGCDVGVKVNPVFEGVTV